MVVWADWARVGDAMTAFDDAVEAMAHAIWTSDGLGNSEGWGRTKNQEVYRRRARAALNAGVPVIAQALRDEAAKRVLQTGSKSYTAWEDAADFVERLGK